MEVRARTQLCVGEHLAEILVRVRVRVRVRDGVRDGDRDRARDRFSFSELALPAEALAGQAVVYVPRRARFWLDDAFHGGAAGPDKKVFVLAVARSWLS